MENEEWRNIKEFEGLYDVSNYGRIYSIRSDKILKLIKGKEPYLLVRLSNNYKETIIRVHRLVAQAFIPNPNNLPVVNHRDGNKLNNYASNLEWTTHKENILHARKLGLFKNEKVGEERHTSILKESQVIEILTRLSRGELAKDIVKDYPVNKDQISKIKHGVQWKHVNFDRSIFSKEIDNNKILLLKQLFDSGRSLLSLETEFNIPRKRIKKLINDIV